MFIDRQSPAMPAISAHKKQGGTSQDEIKAFKKRNGYINLDNPEHKKRYQNAIGDKPANDYRPLHCVKTRKEAVQKAEAEHRAALARLADGTAVHRQPSDRLVAAKKIKAIKKKASTSQQIRPADQAKPKPSYYVKRPPNAATLAKLARRAAITETLKSGRIVAAINWRGDDFSDHQQQAYDLSQIAKKERLNVVRLINIKTRVSGFMVDSFERSDIKEPISCLLIGPNKNTVLSTICSGKILTVDNLIEPNTRSALEISKLVHKYGFNLYSVTKSSKLIGWVEIKENNIDEQIAKADVDSDRSRLQKAAHLGGALQGLDYLKLRAEIRAQMPGASDSDINDATWTEYKRVYTDGQ